MLVHWRMNIQTFPSEDALNIEHKLEFTQEPNNYFFLSLKRLLSYFSLKCEVGVFEMMEERKRQSYID